MRDQIILLVAAVGGILALTASILTDRGPRADGAPLPLLERNPHFAHLAALLLVLLAALLIGWKWTSVAQ